MTLPVSGAISFNNINVELGVSGTTTASLGQASYRTLAGVASGAISMSNFYGKSNQFAFTISSNQTNANLRTLAINAGWNQSSQVVATISNGIYISSNSTGTPALTVNGSFPNGVSLINNGYIIGMGGAGGAGVNQNGGGTSGGAAGSTGGLALSVASTISITNNGTIGGGGGGGGGGGCTYTYDGYFYAGYGSGGGGGGRSGVAANSSGGSRGAITLMTYTYYGTNGAVGTSTSGGSGGSAGAAGSIRGGVGGGGGSWGSSGSAGGNPSPAGTSGRSGGSGGGAVSGNANITWVATGTRLGAIT